jgi:hypothetical protein
MLPNVVIAGAPKCGTTSLFRWLVDHPQVCGSSIKETRFLMDPGYVLFKKKSNFRDHGLAGYEAYFDDCAALSAKVVLEATPTYLYQRTAPEVLSDLEPTPDIVFIFRKPSDRAYSHFHYFQDTKARIDRRVSFREFVELALNEDPRILEVGTEDASKMLVNARYADYVPRWLARFPPARLHFFLFEDMKRDPLGFVRVICDRLQLESGFFDSYDLKKRNRTFRVRSARLHNIRRRVGRVLPASTRKKLKTRTKWAYARVNVDGSQLEPTADELDVMTELDRHFKPLNERLAELTGLDLTAWREPAAQMSAPVAPSS